MSRRTLSLLMLILAMLACNFPTGEPEAAPSETPFVLFTATQAQPVLPAPSNTPLPSQTSSPTMTATPSVPVIFPKDVAVNCRFGPGTAWQVTSGLTVGATAELVGKNTEQTWWYVRDPLNPGKFCWLSMSVTNTAGNVTNIQVVSTPDSLITNVKVDAKVDYIACGGPNPITFSGSITTNGPATLKYEWEIGGDTSANPSAEMLEFNSFGTKEITAPVFKADCGNYFIILRAVGSNEVFARKDFKVGPP